MLTDEDLYRAYPRHVKRIRAIQAIEVQVRLLAAERFKMDKDAARIWLHERILDFANQWQGRPRADLRYCPHMTTWLHDGRFDDEEETDGIDQENLKFRRLG